MGIFATFLRNGPRALHCAAGQEIMPAYGFTLNTAGLKGLVFQ